MSSAVLEIDKFPLRVCKKKIAKRESERAFRWLRRLRRAGRCTSRKRVKRSLRTHGLNAARQMPECDAEPDRLYRMRVLCCGSEGRVCVHCLGRHRLMFGLRRGAISWRPNVHGHLLYNLPRGSIAGFGRAGGLRALRERMAGFVGRNRVYRVQLPTGDCRARQRPKYTLQSVQAPRDADKGGVHAR